MGSEDRGSAALAERAQRDPASFIDHTLLKAEARPVDIDRLCDEARAFGFAAVCVHGRDLPQARRQLPSSEGPRVAVVVDFPLGAGGVAERESAVRWAWDAGADEIDLVFDRGGFLSGDESRVASELARIASWTPRGGALKLILETAALPEEARRRAAALGVAAGVDTLKTSTGLGPGGATVADVRLLREIAGWECGVKASGGIRDAETFRAMIAAGASRIGTSSGRAIMEGLQHG